MPGACVSAAAGTAGACFDVLCVGARYILGNWPSKVCSHPPESRVGPSQVSQALWQVPGGWHEGRREPTQELASPDWADGQAVCAGSLFWMFS